MSEKKHVDFIHKVLGDKSHGFWYVNPLFTTGEWILQKTTNLRRGRSLCVIEDLDKDLPEYFFIKDENNKSYLTIMNESGLPEDILIEKGNIFLYTYNSPFISLFKDEEKKFNRSHINAMHIVEYDKKLYIPFYFKIDDVFEEVYKKGNGKYKDFVDKEAYPRDLSRVLSYNYEHEDYFIDDDMMDMLLIIEKLTMSGFNDLAMYVEEHFEEFNSAIDYCYKKEDIQWNERKKLYTILKELEEDYFNDLSDKTETILSVYEDYDEIDDEYVETPFWYEISNYDNGNMIITVKNVKTKQKEEVIKLKIREEYKNREDVIESALNHICLALVFINQCWFEEDYNDGYDI